MDFSVAEESRSEVAEIDGDPEANRGLQLTGQQGLHPPKLFID